LHPFFDHADGSLETLPVQP